MGIVFLVIFFPVILPLLIIGYTILFNDDKWTGKKKDTQAYRETYYDKYIHSVNNPLYESNDKIE